MRRPLLEMADIVRCAGQAFVERSRRWINWQHRKVLLAIERCRTAALGGHRDRCTGCGQTTKISYNSCRNRHCPRCQGNARMRWLKARERELLPTRYVHAVFTLPHELAPLALQNKRIIYNLLFHASAETLLEIARDPRHLGAEIGFFSVLHSWSQRLEFHPHVHCVIAAGGLAPDHASWITARHSFFLPIGVLSRVFRGKFSGPAVPVAQNIGSRSGAYGYYSVSPAGVLVYTAESTSIENTPGQLTWYSRSGEKLGTVGQPEIVSTPALSPDGTRLAVTVGQPQKEDIWVFDLKRGTASRLTFDSARNSNPVWSADGSQILVSSLLNGNVWDIYQKDANGLGTAQPVFRSSDQLKAINDLSPDGRYAIYDTANSFDTSQLWGLPLFGDRKPFAFVQGKFGATSARFSPIGRFLAYTSNETGRKEVYVQTFPEHTGKWQISTSGGEQPMWSRDGKELFYLAAGNNGTDTKLMSVAVNTGSAAFQADIPKELFQTQLIPFWFWRNLYVPSPDGHRFLMVAPASQPKPEPVTVVVNWPSLLKSSGSR